MKILILANEEKSFYHFRHELIEKIIQLGHDVYISVPSGEHKTYFEQLGCHCYEADVDRRGMNPLKDLKLLSYYKKLMKTIQPELVVTYTIKCNVYGGMAAKGRGIPYVVNITGLGSAFQKKGLLQILVTQLYKNALKKVKVVFFENESNKQVFIDSKIVPENRTCVLNGAGVNLDHFKVLPYNDEKTTRLLFIGRIMKEKGVEELFSAAKRCKANNINVAFDFIGDYEDNYKNVVENLIANNVINYYGYQMDIQSYVEKADCILLPSYHEGMSNALLEGAAMGRALLATDIPGCREAVIDGKTGYLFKKADANDLYDKIVKFASLAKEQQKKMGLAGREHMEKVFDKNKVVDKTIEELRKRE